VRLKIVYPSSQPIYEITFLEREKKFIRTVERRWKGLDKMVIWESENSKLGMT
jgi:hypothetical protein